MTVEQIQSLSKIQQYELLKSLRPFLSISMADVARMSDVSSGLVTYVFQGVNSNPKVLSTILNNLNDGWQDAIPQDIQLQVA